MTGNYPRDFLRHAVIGETDGGAAAGTSPITAYAAGSPDATWGASFGFNAYGASAIAYRQAAGLFGAHPPSRGFMLDLATGQDASGGIQTTGDLADAHWTVTNADTYKNGPIAYTVAPGNPDWYTQWMANGPGSSWIAADPDTGRNGNVTYTFTFDLSGFDPAAATLANGRFVIDDGGTVYLNGHALGSQAYGQFGGFTALSNGAGDFVAGVNTLVIQTSGSDHYDEAARFEGTIVDTVRLGPPSPVHWANPISGDFTTGADWTGGAVPGANNDAILDAAGSTAYTVTSSTSETVHTIQTAATATLAISGGTFTASNGTGTGANAGTIQIGTNGTLAIGGSVTNSGTIGVDGTTPPFGATLVIARDTTLSGAGSVVLSSNVNNSIDGPLGVSLTNVDNTISGSGVIGAYYLALVNERAGVIDGTSDLSIGGQSSSMITNAGLIEATSGFVFLDGSVVNTGALMALGASLQIFSNEITNTGGTLIAASGGSVLLAGVALAGGAVTVATGGSISVEGGAITGARVSIATGGRLEVGPGATSLTPATFNNAGTISVFHGASLAVGGSLVNSGTITLEGVGGGGVTSLEIGGDTTLSGAGQVTLSDQSLNQIVGGASAASLINVNNTISGAGTIGSSILTLVNRVAGVIDATGANRLILNTGANAIVNAGLIETTGAGGMTIESAVANTGQLMALGAGALTIQNATVTNTGGGLVDAAGAHVSLRGGTITGGTVSIAAGGLLSADSGSNAVSAGAFTNAGTVSVADGASLAISRSLVNSGTIELDGAKAVTSLVIGGATTLSGAGQVILSDQPLNQVVGGASAVSLVNVDNTISGAGTIGSSTLTLVNRAAGVIDATGADRLILNTGSNTIVNAGLIEAVGAGGMTIESAVANAGGVIAAGNGSRVALLGADVIGGRLETTGGSAFRIMAGAASKLDGGASALHDQAQIIVTRRAALTIEGSIVNGKGIRLDGKGVGAPTLSVGASGVTLSGGGVIAMDDSAGNLIVGATSAATLTNVDNVIGGAGRLGGGQLSLVNEAMGVISGNQATALVIDTGANTVVNAGLIVSRGAGGTTIESAVANSGRLEAVGSVLTVDGAVSGAGVAVIKGGEIDFTSSFSQAVMFEHGMGELGLAQSRGYGGAITGFSKTGGTSLDLGDIAFVGAGEATFSGDKSGGVLTVTDGTNTASLTLKGDYRGTAFTASGDGHGGTIVVGGPAPAAFVAAMAALAAPPGHAIQARRDAGGGHAVMLARPHAFAA